MLSYIFRHLVILCGFLILSGQATAQKEWTLQECIDHALKNNISVKQGEVSVEQSKITLTQKKMQMIPSLNGNASHNYNFGRSVDPFSNLYTTQELRSSNLSLSSNVTLFNGLQLQNELKQSRLDYIAGEYDLQKIRNDISLNVVSAFLQVLYARESLVAANNQKDRSLSQRDRTKIMTDAGSLTQGNLLDAESQFALDELAVINAESALSIAILSLTQLLELESPEGFTAAAPLSDVPDISILAQTPAAIYQMALQQLPELKSAQVKVESAERGVSIAKGGRSPRISAFGSIGTASSSSGRRVKDSEFLGLYPNGSITSGGDTILSPIYSTTFEETPVSDQFDQNYNKSLGFSMSIPLFNGWATESGIRRARLNLLNAEYNEDLQQKQVFKSIQQAYADAIAGQKKYAASQKSAEALEASFNYSQRKYEAGLISSLDWLTSKNNFAKGESDALQAKYDYIFRVKVLDFYAGKPLTL